MDKSIEFVSWKEDDSIEIQLEPEAFVFIVQPGSVLKFEPVNPSDDFKWALRINHNEKGVQLFPDGKSYEGINIYEDNKLREDWSKLYSL